MATQKTETTENIWHNAPEIRIIECARLLLRRWCFSNLSVPYWRLYWNDRSGARVLFEGKTFDLQPSIMTLIPPYISFSSSLSRFVSHHCIHFIATAPYTTIKPRVYSFPAKPEFIAVMSRIRDIETADDLQKAWLMMALLHICHYALSLIPKEDLMMFYADHRIQAVVDWMEQHLDQPLSNKTLAGVAAMHPSGFIRLFRACTGRTPKIYLRIKRIDRACLLLDTTNASIDEIATQTGFCDRFYFSRVFHAIYHINPAAYRKRHRSEVSKYY